MTTPLTYAEFLIVFLGPPIAVVALLTRRRLSPQFIVGATLVGIIGLLYTTPWDNFLIGRGVWWYGGGAVLARIYLAPVEEYAFMILQPVLTALWVLLLRSRRVTASRPSAESIGPVDSDTWTTLTWRTRIAGGIVALFIGLGGLLMLLTDATFYMGAILLWASPVLAVQWAFGWTHLWKTRRLVAFAVGVPTLYLAAADRVAIELGIWSLSTQFTTGVLVAGLPIEEGAFFLLTNVFVVQGLLLFLWVVDQPVEADSASTGESALNQ